MAICGMLYGIFMDDLLRIQWDNDGIWHPPVSSNVAGWKIPKLTGGLVCWENPRTIHAMVDDTWG